MKNFLKILGILLCLAGAWTILDQVDDPPRGSGIEGTPEKKGVDAGPIDPKIGAIDLSAPLSAMVRTLGECPERTSKEPLIVLVIDDLGPSPRISEQVSLLPGPLTLSFLPLVENVGNQTSQAARRGHEVFLHLPMQPRSGTSPLDREQVLRADAPPVEIQALTDRHLERLKGYQGVNNHMGSRFTADAKGMALVLEAVRRRGLTWLDSVTSIDTVGPHIARHLSIPWLKRDVFLDHDPNPEAIEKQIRRAETIARERGVATVIAHPKEATIAALRRWLPRLKKSGFRLAGASRAAGLLDRCGVYAPAATAPVPTG